MPVTQKTTMAHLATDPLRNFKFIVSIPSASNSGTPIQMGFMAVSGLNITTEVISYREGAMNTTTQKMPGQSDFSPITLSHGIAVGHSEDLQWMKQLFTVIQGTGGQAAGTDFRRNIDVKILDHPVTTSTVPVKAWFRIYNAWPTTWSASDLDAGASQLLVAQLALAHEGWDMTLAGSIGSAEAPAPGSAQS
jgi:phage tail-like protein